MFLRRTLTDFYWFARTGFDRRHDIIHLKKKIGEKKRNADGGAHRFSAAKRPPVPGWAWSTRRPTWAAASRWPSRGPAGRPPPAAPSAAATGTGPGPASDWRTASRAAGRQSTCPSPSEPGAGEKENESFVWLCIFFSRMNHQRVERFSRQHQFNYPHVVTKLNLT